MPAKKGKKKVKKASVKAKPKKAVKKRTAKAKPARIRAPVRPAPVQHVPHRVEDALRHEMEVQGKDIFYPEEKWTLWHWIKKYSPVLVTMLIGLATYFYLVFYLFYPTTIIQGHYFQLLLLLVFIFLISGILIYLGLKAELLFVRILSFIFVFVIFTFLLLFILLAHTMNAAG
ncbi:hypothetical protein KY359_04100 [Candidatus Woesearchaeota archaeon]|nr:hypothetical protein [Candidatus Woesearchaeota archaeon]